MKKLLITVALLFSVVMQANAAAPSNPCLQLVGTSWSGSPISDQNEIIPITITIQSASLIQGSAWYNLRGIFSYKYKKSSGSGSLGSSNDGFACIKDSDENGAPVANIYHFNAGLTGPFSILRSSLGALILSANFSNMVMSQQQSTSIALIPPKFNDPPEQTFSGDLTLICSSNCSNVGKKN